LLVVVAVVPLMVALVSLVRHRLTVGLVQKILVLAVTVELAQVTKRVGLVVKVSSFCATQILFLLHLQLLVPQQLQTQLGTGSILLLRLAVLPSRRNLNGYRFPQLTV
jgi:hypothetical protein